MSKTEKREKKEKKDKKRKRESVDESSSTDPTPSSLPALHASLNVKTVSSDWRSAFAAAAQVLPEGLDDDFLQRTETTTVDEGLAKIKMLLVPSPERNDAVVMSTKHQKEDEPPREKKRKMETPPPLPVEDEDEAPVQHLEGRMVPHPMKHTEQVMLLVDPNKRIAYSALKRTEEGDRIVLGTVNEDKSISWKENAFDEDEDNAPDFPFDTDPDDHCETPIESYRDIVPMLEQLEDYNTSLSIYDPYYCNGSVKVHLKELGFPKVYNEKEDCYLCWKSGVGYPTFDVLITNPPYSEDHIPKLIAHLTSKMFHNKPFMLLMPEWVHKKDYYMAAMKRAKIQPFFLVPKKRYVYLPPPQFRTKTKSDVHKKSSPFVSFWYIWGGSDDANYELMEGYRAKYGMEGPCEVARTKNALRDLRRKDKRKQFAA